MNIELIYASKTGHSKKIARAIAEELKIKMNNVNDQPTLESIDLLFIVGGIYGGKSMPEMIDFVNTLNNKQVRKVILITSCVSKRTGQTQIRKLLSEKNIEVLDKEFICQGNFLFFGSGHPDKTDVDNAVEFAKNTAEKFTSY